MSVFVVRAFVKLREVFASHRELAGKLTDLEQKLGMHDDAIKAIILTIRELMGENAMGKTRKIGFERDRKK